MRKTIGVCLLVLLLTSSANAGIIPNWPPTPPPSAIQKTGEMPTPDSLIEIALDLLAGLL